MTKTTTQAIKVTTVNTTLDSNSWATIKAVSDAGKGDNYWDVGDTRNIVINGNVGESVYKNITIAAFIIGFNHNSIIEGNNKIHFQIGKISNKLIGLCDGRYGSSVSGSGYFSMNTYRTNAGGWNDSYMRKTLLGNSGTPSSPPSNSLLAAISADLRAVMKDVRKFTDNTGGGADHVSYVTGTTDYLFLLAEFEYHGSRTYANSAEKNYQKQYDYYKAGNSKVHNRFETRNRLSMRGPVPPVPAATIISACQHGRHAQRRHRGLFMGAGPWLCRLIAAAYPASIPSRGSGRDKAAGVFAKTPKPG